MASAIAVMNMTNTHQVRYLAEVHVVVLKSLIHRDCRRCLPECRTKKRVFDQLNDDRTLREGISEQEQ